MEGIFIISPSALARRLVFVPEKESRNERQETKQITSTSPTWHHLALLGSRRVALHGDLTNCIDWGCLRQLAHWEGREDKATDHEWIRNA